MLAISSSLMSLSGVTEDTPAQFITPAIGPTCLTVSFTFVTTNSTFVKSRGSTMCLSPPICDSVSCNRCSLRAMRTTLAPIVAQSIAHLAPMPLLAPVTRIVLPSNENGLFITFLLFFHLPPQQYRLSYSQRMAQ